MRRQGGIRTVATLVAVLSVLASGCGWTRYRGDTQHTGTNPAEHAIGLGNLSSLQTSWTTADRHFWYEPVFSGGRVFVATRVSIYAYDATTGAQLWRRTDLPTPHPVSELRQPSTGAGGVYVTNRWFDPDPDFEQLGFGAVTYALDPATGATVRTYVDAGTELPPLVTDDGWVYLASAVGPAVLAFGPHGEHFVVPAAVGVQDIIGDAGAIRFVTTQTVQSFAPHGCGQTTCATFRTDVVPVGNQIPAHLAENAATEFVLNAGTLYAYPRDGCGAARCDAAWTSSSYLGQTDGLVVTDDAVYVTATGAMRVFDAHGCGSATCAPLWSSALDPSDTVHSPMLANGVLVASVYGNGLVGLAAWNASGCGAATCAPTWTLASGVSEHPVINNGALYFLVTTGFGQALRKLSLPG